MARIEFTPSLGENPIQGFGANTGAASCAVNSKFWHGDLRPFQCPTETCKDRDIEETIKTMYSTCECACISWDVVVDIADCHCDFVVWTGDGKPQIAKGDELCNGESCDLGVPCPDAPPEATTEPCIDTSAECAEGCESAFTVCEEAAYAACDETAVQALRDALDACLKTQQCNDPSIDCDQTRRDYMAAKLALNDCKACAKEAAELCKEAKAECEESCPEEDCCDKQCGYYLYRYVNKYGQVGAPSPISGMVELSDTVDISGIPQPADGCITEVEIFALIAGDKKGLEQKIQNNSAFISQGVFPIGGTLTVPLTGNGLELDSWDYYPPPEDLQGVVCTDYGMAGFTDKCVWYTEANQIHAWNKKKCLDHKVKALKFHNGSLYALTDSWLYRMNLTAGNGDYDFSTPFRYGDRPLPLIGDSRSVSVGQSGIFYPSTMGGVLANNSQAQVITSRFAKDDWLSINPKTMQTEMFDYGVGMFTDMASYMYEFGDGTFGEASGQLYQLPFKPDATYVDNSGTLNYSVGNKWYKWDACYTPKEPCTDTPISLTDCCCPYTWQSEPLLFDTQTKLQDGFIEFVAGTGDVKVEIFEEGCTNKTYFEETFNSASEQCRKNRCHRKYFQWPVCEVQDQLTIRLTGCAHVRRVVLGSSRSALKG